MKQIVLEVSESLTEEQRLAFMDGVEAEFRGVPIIMGVDTYVSDAMEKADKYDNLMLEEDDNYDN